MRLYAARYPDEVVGLVLVDPEHERTDVEMSKLDPAYLGRRVGRLSSLTRDASGSGLRRA